MPLHQRAMVVCNAAPLIFKVSPAHRRPPDIPNAPGAALTRKAETPKRTPAWGFCFGIGGASIALVARCGGASGRASQPAPRRNQADLLLADL